MSVLIRATVAVLRGPDWLARALTSVPATIDGQVVHPRTRLFLSLLRLDPVVRHHQSVAKQRADIDFLERATSGPLAPGSIEDVSVALPGRTLGARVYRPLAASPVPNPALLYLHGGGFVTGQPAGYDAPCARIAHACGVVVVSLAYRLAPEHPFPAALDDSVDGFHWLSANAEKLGVDPARLAIGGDSAGGNLAAVAARLLTWAGWPRPSLQVLLYPSVDMDSTLPSRTLFARGFFLTSAQVQWFHEQYIPDAAMRRDPRASPLLADDLAGLPPALIVTAGFDPLRDEARVYADKLAAAGVQVERMEVEGMVHGFVTLDGILPAADDAMEELTKRLRRLLAGAG